MLAKIFKSVILVIFVLIFCVICIESIERIERIKCYQTEYLLLNKNILHLSDMKAKKIVLFLHLIGALVDLRSSF